MSVVRSKHLAAGIRKPLHKAETTNQWEQRVEAMIAAIDIDEYLLAKATKLLGTMDRGAIVNTALKALIERESAMRLAKLGGTQPHLKAAPRRR